MARKDCIFSNFDISLSLSVSVSVSISIGTGLFAFVILSRIVSRDFVAFSMCLADHVLYESSVLDAGGCGTTEQESEWCFDIVRMGGGGLGL